MGLNERTASRARAILAAQHLSISDYAERTGQSFDQASRRLNGRVEFSLTDIERFATLTGYKPAELVDDEFVLKPAPALADALAKEAK